MKGILSLYIFEWWVGFDFNNVDDVISLLLRIEDSAGDRGEGDEEFEGVLIVANECGRRWCRVEVVLDIVLWVPVYAVRVIIVGRDGRVTLF